DRLSGGIAERSAQPLHHESQQKRVGHESERDIDKEAERLIHHRYLPSLPNSSPSSRARAAAAFTAATIVAFTAPDSMAAIARSVVPPFDVTCARSVAGSSLLAFASVTAPSNVAYARRRASSAEKPSSRAAASSASRK